MLDQAFEALKTYDWGTDRNLLDPIDDAVIAAHGNAAARKELETRLAAVLKTGVSRDAKDYVCRKLMVIGTAASVPTLAALLPTRTCRTWPAMPWSAFPPRKRPRPCATLCRKSAAALKVGVIGSLGVRRDTASVPALAALLGRCRRERRRSGRLCAGRHSHRRCRQGPGGGQAGIRRGQASRHRRQPGLRRGAVGRRQEGRGAGDLQVTRRRSQPKHVRLAATRGMLACAGK